MSKSSASKTILGTSPAVKELLKLIQKVAASKTNLLVIGESGTGKELVARMIHDSGPLQGKPFIPVNCGAIPETLIESEMFGHKRGSFTGAVSDKIGLFEAANGGTLFLDEVGELPLPMQVKLLRAIQERTIRKVGGTDDVRVDVRIIAATNRDLEAAVRSGTFREDLYYRLNVILIKTPPLREREGDVRLLADAFLKRFSEKMKKNLKGFSSSAWAAIEGYRWPGNIRELENTIERCVTLETGEEVSLDVLPPAVTQAVAVKTPSTGEVRLLAPDFSKESIRLDEILEQVEKWYLVRAIEHASGSKKKVAELLGISPKNLGERLSRLGMSSGD